MAEIELLRCQIELETDLQTKTIHALKIQQVRMTDANIIKKLAELKSKAEATTILKKAEAHDERLRA